MAQEAPDMLVPKLAEIGTDIIKRSQEAKIVENLSTAQIELGKLSNDFQIKYQGDPFNEDGLKEFKEQRQSVLDKYGENISPFFGRAWSDSAAKLSNQIDLGVQSWGFKQAVTNTRQSIANANSNGQIQAEQAGEALGRGEIDLPELMLTISSSVQDIKAYGQANLGETSTDTLAHDMVQDRIKGAMSGLAKTNPVQALRFMNSDAVKGAVTNQPEWAEFTKAVENRALNFQDVAKQTEILNTLKGENALLASGKVLSYSEIQQTTGGMSEEAKKYFLRINGYTKDGDGDGPAWDDDRKIQERAGLYDKIASLSQNENFTPEDVQGLQGDIYKLMRKDALTQNQGADFLGGLVQPVISQQEERMQEFSTGHYNPFKTNAGFSDMQEYYDTEIEIKPAEGKKKVSSLDNAINATNKTNLYDNYWNSLQTQAAKKNIPVGDIANSPDKDAIYAKAKQDAINDYKAKSSPVLKVQPSIPITAIKRLLDNPSKAGDFDKMFGPGAANRILGK